MYLLLSKNVNYTFFVTEWIKLLPTASHWAKVEAWTVCVFRQLSHSIDGHQLPRRGNRMYESTPRKRRLTGGTQRHHSVCKGWDHLAPLWLFRTVKCSRCADRWTRSRRYKRVVLLKTGSRFSWPLRSVSGHLKAWFTFLHQGVTGAHLSS